MTYLIRILIGFTYVSKVGRVLMTTQIESN